MCLQPEWGTIFIGEVSHPARPSPVRPGPTGPDPARPGRALRAVRAQKRASLRSFVLFSGCTFCCCCKGLSECRIYVLNGVCMHVSLHSSRWWCPASADRVLCHRQVELVCDMRCYRSTVREESTQQDSGRQRLLWTRSFGVRIRCCFFRVSTSW